LRKSRRTPVHFDYAAYDNTQAMFAPCRRRCSGRRLVAGRQLLVRANAGGYVGPLLFLRARSSGKRSAIAAGVQTVSWTKK